MKTEKARKIVLGISYIIALIPICFQWFDIGNGAEIREFGWRGFGILRLEFYISVLAYYLFLWRGRWKCCIGAQILTIISYFVALSRFTIRTNISSVQDWNLTLNGLRWTFFLAIITLLANILLSLLLYKLNKHRSDYII